ncbi:MAG: ester cyclase [Gammaproteobacteria bacterium]|nr:ester cyclase [Gammaproteobacteria bacterium]
MEDRKSVVRCFIEDMVSTGKTDQLSTVIADDYVDYYSNSSRRGPEVARTHIEAVRSTYPDLIVKVIEQYCDGDVVISTIRGTATHKGKWLNIEPTNKPIVIDGVNINRVVEGKIVSHSGFANTLEALLEIGALPGIGTS